jgi:Flp pilus assembly protein TadG
MVGVPFFMMLFAIIETAIMFFAQEALETATQDTAR